MAKKKTEQTQVIETSIFEDRKLEREVFGHLEGSKDYMSDLRSTWDDKEAMLLGRLKDDISQNSTKSQVFDPRLSTIVFDRAARVMAQEHVGHAYAMSKDDIGKNKLMDLLVKHFNTRANEQFPMLTKSRMLDLYSLVYGSMFALVPWRVNMRNDYVGPEMTIIPIRDMFPQSNVVFNDSDWVQVRTWVSLNWLKGQDKNVWKNIDAIEEEYKGTAGDSKDGDEEDTSYSERTFHTHMDVGDKAFPQIELITEYRHDRWITFSPRSIHRDGSSTKILRVVENPYIEGMLPVVKKDAFPLIDRAVGLGEFERGERLQKSINSLINLYLDGVKMSIFPPIQINPKSDGLVPSSITQTPAARWLVGRPNQDVQITNISPQGINTFNSTYGFLVGALNSQAGTTSISEGDETKTTIGKTPQAIQMLRARENARDEWDRHMMDETIKQVYTRWVNLISDNMEQTEQVRIFGAEIEEIAKNYPDIKDVVDISTSGKQAVVKVSSKDIKSKYDYQVEPGSTMKRDTVQEAQAVREILEIVLSNPDVIARVEQEGKAISMAELFTRVFATSGIQDWDKIITDKETQPNLNGGDGGQVPPNQVPPEMMGQMPPQQMPQQTPQVASQQYNDPDIMQAAQQLLGGISGVPPQR